MYRAVYRDVDIYLLDNPLSAVDVHVAKRIFQDCMNGLLKDKIRILVTHQRDHLEAADEVIFINNVSKLYYSWVIWIIDTREL